MEVLIYGLTAANTCMLFYVLYRFSWMQKSLHRANDALWQITLLTEYLSFVQAESDDYEVRASQAAEKYEAVLKERADELEEAAEAEA